MPRYEIDPEKRLERQLPFICKEVRRRRRELELVQKQIARGAGVSTGTIGEIENGRQPRADLVVKLARVLKCTPHDLLGWQEETNDEKVT